MASDVSQQREPISPATFLHLKNGKASLWHSSAPKKLTSEEDFRSSSSWNAWLAYLGKRTKPASLFTASKEKSSPFVWALPTGPTDSETEGIGPATEKLLQSLASVQKKKNTQKNELANILKTWLSSTKEAPASLGLAIESVAVANALPQLTKYLSADIWWSVLDQLLGLANEADAIDAESMPLEHLILAGELPLTLAILLPELKPCRKQLHAGQKVLRQSFEDLLDNDGTLMAAYWQQMRPLLACWTRCFTLGKQSKEKVITKTVQAQFDAFVCCNLKGTRSGGRQMLAGVSASAGQRDLLQAALGHVQDPEVVRAAAITLPGKKSSAPKKICVDDLPDPTCDSPWAGIAVLRPDWSPRGEHLLVDYSRTDTHLELAVGRHALLSGRWEIELHLDHENIPIEGEWEQICWDSDDDIDYLELEIDLLHGVKIQRQILLPRNDQFLFLSDNILTEKQRDLEYTSRLGLAEGVRIEETKEHTELTLATDKSRALLLPLSLSEWKSDPRFGKLSSCDDSITLSQSATARNLACPLFIDLAPKRWRKRYTWRQLTIAESLEIQPKEIAVGYRVQSADQQWMFYRALANRANRTLLAQNLTSEFLAARLDLEGDIEELIEIEH